MGVLGLSPFACRLCLRVACGRSTCVVCDFVLVKDEVWEWCDNCVLLEQEIGRRPLQHRRPHWEPHCHPGSWARASWTRRMLQARSVGPRSVSCSGQSDDCECACRTCLSYDHGHACCTSRSDYLYSHAGWVLRGLGPVWGLRLPSDPLGPCTLLTLCNSY